ncbi:pyridoxamine 5'-phosphate oxidase family protein [Actinomadura napierensis]|uniref:Pyridoxamine 5'-phosphate oxidase family protein n=1 Tax=Actinomadura napierensis TaxID=267854 RepID=A0ABP5K943_9ACTN
MNDETGARNLSRAECKTLLSSETIGRVVFTDQALPAVTPVRFTVDDGGLVVCAPAGERLGAAVRGTIVAFQADRFDPAGLTGWTITVVGHARAVGSPDERVRSALGPSGPGTEYFRIPFERFSGHSVGHTSTA